MVNVGQEELTCVEKEKSDHKGNKLSGDDDGHSHKNGRVAVLPKHTQCKRYVDKKGSAKYICSDRSIDRFDFPNGLHYIIDYPHITQARSFILGAVVVQTEPPNSQNRARWCCTTMHLAEDEDEDEDEHATDRVAPGDAMPYIY